MTVDNNRYTTRQLFGKAIFKEQDSMVIFGS